jgi:hypothetical protein
LQQQQQLTINRTIVEDLPSDTLDAQNDEAGAGLLVG